MNGPNKLELHNTMLERLANALAYWDPSKKTKWREYDSRRTVRRPTKR